MALLIDTVIYGGGVQHRTCALVKPLKRLEYRAALGFAYHRAEAAVLM